MARGRRADSDEAREAKGNPGRHKRKQRAKISLNPPKNTAPRELSPAGRRIWGALATDLSALRFLRDTDKMAFARYCEHAAKWWQLTRDIEKNGFSSITESNHVTMERVRPAFLVRERIERRLESLEDRFGLNPAARQQILQRLAGLVPAPAGDLFAAKGHDTDPSEPEHQQPSAIGLLIPAGTA